MDICNNKYKPIIIGILIVLFLYWIAIDENFTSKKMIKRNPRYIKK